MPAKLFIGHKRPVIVGSPTLEMVRPVDNSVHRIGRGVGHAIDELQFLRHIGGVFVPHRGRHGPNLSQSVMNKPVGVGRGGQRDHDLLSSIGRDTLPQGRHPANAGAPIGPRRVAAAGRLHDVPGKDHILGRDRTPIGPFVFGAQCQHIPRARAVVGDAGYQRSGIVDLVLLIEQNERSVHHAVDLGIDIAKRCRGQLRKKPVGRGLGGQSHHRRAAGRRLCRTGLGPAAALTTTADASTIVRLFII